MKRLCTPKTGERKEKHREEERLRSLRPERKAALRARYATDEEYRRRRRGYVFKRAYGITIDDRDAMLIEQGGRCKLCGDTTAFAGSAGAHLDHCHDTKRVRGILCANCNVGLGMFGTSTARLRAAIAYLELFNA